MANKTVQSMKFMSDMANRKILADRERFGQVALKAYTSIALITLNKEFGFGASRLNKFQKEFEFQCDCLTGEFASIDDFEKLANELAKRVKLEEN